jgi:peptidoglycan/LPS O-acetylase OafA/YrhL
LPALDGLRAISILLVLATHMLPLGPKSARLNETAGAMGMSLFFALSGFLITSTLLRNGNVVEFMIRRLARIVPLAYAYIVFCFFVMGFGLMNSLWTATFLVNYVPQYLTNFNHFWSLCVEVQFYFAIGLAVLLAGQKAIWIVWPACLAVTAMRINTGTYIDIRTHLRIDEILTGACVASVYAESWKGWLPASSIWLSAVLWFACSSPYSEGLEYLRPYATAVFLTAVLSAPKSYLTEFLASRPMRYIADISYALYIIHPITIYGWWNEGSIVDRYVFKRPISFLMTFLAAHLSTFYWERRWQDAARAWITHRRALVPINTNP